MTSRQGGLWLWWCRVLCLLGGRLCIGLGGAVGVGAAGGVLVQQVQARALKQAPALASSVVAQASVVLVWGMGVLCPFASRLYCPTPSSCQALI